MAGAIKYRQAVTLTATSTSVAVTLDHAFADTNYQITFEAPVNFGFIWPTNKTTTGFTLNVETVDAGYNREIGLELFHE